MLTLHRARPFGYVLTRDGAATDDPHGSILVQHDYDYPSIAGTFGWSPRMVAVTYGTRFTPNPRSCTHDGTDGTIACDSCGTPAWAFISHAADWLDSHDGATADDPGYFTAD